MYVHEKPGECNVVVNKWANLSSKFANAITAVLRMRGCVKLVDVATQRPYTWTSIDR